MGTLLDRPFGPTSGAASVANQTGQNVAAAQAGPLPALQLVVAVAETLILNPENLAVALSIAIPPNTPLEQTVFDLVASGYIKTTAAGNITLKLYEGVVISAGNLLGSSGAIAQATATAAFFVRARLIYDSVTGVLAGTIGFYVNKTLVAEVTLSNFVGGFLNQGNPSANPPTVANLPVFCLSITSSGAAAGTPTTINVQKFCCG
jgi:hypothetical protein